MTDKDFNMDFLCKKGTNPLSKMGKSFVFSKGESQQLLQFNYMEWYKVYMLP